MCKQRNVLARVVRSPVFKTRVVKPRKGKGSYSRKSRNRDQRLLVRSCRSDVRCLTMAVTIGSNPNGEKNETNTVWQCSH
jgi:stalled ribosome alternative rescue factor ArfA